MRGIVRQRGSSGVPPVVLSIYMALIRARATRARARATRARARATRARARATRAVPCRS